MREHDFSKYLKKNPGIGFPLLHTFRQAVVIPAFDEQEYLFSVLDSIKKADPDHRIAVIIVVNHPEGTESQSSLQLFQELQQCGEKNRFPIYAPDLSGGVGQARKIGMDCFIRHQNSESIENTVIYSLDADSPIAENYFTVCEKTLSTFPDAPGIIIKTCHRQGNTEEEEQAIRRYEKYLERYAQKLKDAGSPYGFICIGSGFAVRGDAYIKAGGMKIKKAGEDFYFLQELAKQGTLCGTSETLVFPSPRISRRVPFGTGRMVENLISGGSLPEIPDEAFDALKKLLESAYSETGFLETKLPVIPGDTAGFFRNERFDEVWQKISANTPSDHDSRVKAFFRWFDGLKTLRFLHAVQRNL